MKLHIGCGRDPKDGWINLDIAPGKGVDLVADLDHDTLPIDDESVDEILGIHVIEHLARPMHVMSELYRIAKPDARLTLACPYGSSDDAWEDPTHVRPYFVGSWSVFAQPYHWRADYGYHADWQATDISIHLDHRVWSEGDAEQALAALMTQRNVAIQQVVELHAIKPARPAKRELFQQAELGFRLIEVK